VARLRAEIVPARADGAQRAVEIEVGDGHGRQRAGVALGPHGVAGEQGGRR
jgi:hypothetical protein